jgi:hypothetical protein
MNGQHAAFVLTTAEERGSVINNSLEVAVWSLAYADNKIIRKEYFYEITEFAGEREITPLDIFPCKFLDIQNSEEIRTNLEM